jgi:hypothetical protein
MLDLSLSMPMRDNFLPAKKVAMALHSLISSQFPRDYLGLVGFSEVARVLTAEQLPEVSWDFVYGTNMQHGFTAEPQAAGPPDRHQADHHDHRRRADRPHHRPTASRSSTTRRCARPSRPPCARWCAAPGGHPHQHVHARRHGYLQAFIEQLTEINRGRAFFTTPETLGDYVLVDFIEHKRQIARELPRRRPRSVLPRARRVHARGQGSVSRVRGSPRLSRVRAAERREVRHLGRAVRA